ncbi:MAG: protease modulator HflC [Betaproteobacteria bacterium]|nr:protease modulator HflC [Betaproteobacteria bacterium]
MNNRIASLITLIAGVLILASLSLYSVDQRQNALVFQLGQIVATQRAPGLYFKMPLVQNVRYFDTRILTLDPNDPDRFITSEKKNVLIDYFAKWRIVDVRQFYVSVGGDETRARTRLQQTINDALRAEIGQRTIHDVVSGERENIMRTLRARADQDARKIGVEVIDVRIKHVDLPQEVSDSVYRRMEAERKRVANELRSTGSAEAEQIRANADRQREVIIADAWRDAQRVKGEGDASASAIYASAFSQNPEFYSFYRSLNAYRQSFHSKQDMLVLDPHSAFFKYMNSPGGSKP